MSLRDQLARMSEARQGFAPASPAATAAAMDTLKQQTKLVLPPAYDKPIHVPIVPGVTESQRFMRARMELADPGQFSEVQRITRLPVVREMLKEECDAFSAEIVLADAYRRGFRLFPPQANGHAAFMEYGGLFGPIGVGWGKTLLLLLNAEHAYRRGIRSSILAIPPAALCQLIETDIPAARLRVPITVPFHVLAGKSHPDRLALAKSGKRGCYIIPHSYFSVRDTSMLLDEIKAGLIQLDECHHFSNRTAARTKRLIQFLEEHGPFATAVSGSISSKSVMEYHHLLLATLRAGNPLPMGATMAAEWGMVIDATAEEDAARAQAGDLAPLIEWAQTKFPKSAVGFDRTGVRTAYRLRLNSAPGVVSTGDNEIGTSLYLVNVPVPKPEKSQGWQELDRLTKQVREAWLTPNGDEIEYAVHMYKWLYELTAGFYYKLDWPDEDWMLQHRRVSRNQATDEIGSAQEHHEYKQAYAKILRKWLENRSKKGLDTPLLVAANMSRNEGRDVGGELFDAWREMKQHEFPNMPERLSSAVRICNFKEQAVVNWARGLKKGVGALIWYYHNEIGEWTTEALRLAGMDPIYCPAGDIHNAKILHHTSASRIVVASISAHGTAKNLQGFQETYFLQWPRSARQAEQVIGRNHRNGQRADELIMVTNKTTEFDDLCFAATLNDAIYTQQTTGNRQKLLYANYDPLPRIYPSEFLHERGFENIPLEAEMRRLLLERFDPTSAAA